VAEGGCTRLMGSLLRCIESQFCNFSSGVNKAVALKTPETYSRDDP